MHDEHDDIRDLWIVIRENSKILTILESKFQGMEKQLLKLEEIDRWRIKHQIELESTAKARVEELKNRKYLINMSRGIILSIVFAIYTIGHFVAKNYDAIKRFFLEMR